MAKKKFKKVKKSNEKDVMSFKDDMSNGWSGNRVWCAIAKTINIGNYESVRVEAGRSREVEDGQDFEEIKDQVTQEVLSDASELIKTVEVILKPKT